MREERSILLIAPIVLAGCAVVTLHRLEQWHEQERFEEIVDAPVPSQCKSTPFTSEACPKIYAIRGHACLQLARGEAEPNAACPPVSSKKANQWLECAVDSYAKSDLPNLPPEDGANLLENHARALYCGARLRVLRDGSPEGGAAMARDATAKLSRLPPDPERDQLAASSALFIAQQEKLSPADRCGAARQAATLASRGLTEVTADQANLTNLLHATKNAAMQEANAIHECK